MTSMVDPAHVLDSVELRLSAGVVVTYARRGRRGDRTFFGVADFATR